MIISGRCAQWIGISGRSSAWFRALAWGARGRWFKSSRPDHTKLMQYIKKITDALGVSLGDLMK